MGWTVFHTEARPTTEILAEELAPAQIVDSATNGGVWYGAVRHPKTGRVFGMVVLFKRRSIGQGQIRFEYKEMSESMRPYARHCPLRILEKLSPLDEGAELARQWRAECTANATGSK